MYSALKMITSVGLVSLASIAPIPVLARSVERVQFARGNDSSAIEAVVTGNGYKDYVLRARIGQTMGVSLISGSTSANFNILPPGSQGEAIYIGSNEGPDANVSLPEGGDYTVRVYLLGNAKDSGASVPLTLSMTIV